MSQLFQELQARDLIKQTNDIFLLEKSLNKDKLSFYIGFDPSSDSLHVGHLLQIMTALRLRKEGHSPVILIGGATAQVGDPTGKSEMRKMLTSEQLQVNVSSLRKQLISLFPGYVFVEDNTAWFNQTNYLSFIKDIGALFNVNVMLRADCFKSRLENGLSFLEFNYMLMQAYDFLMLHGKHNVNLQVGGDDQWSNMLAGLDLIKKKNAKTALVMTVPLLVNSNGQKMGKTETGTIWLDAEKTSVFEFFQFWRNLPDEEIIPCFKKLTFLSVEEINAINLSTVELINSAKKNLAYEITKFVHGEKKADVALNKSQELFEMQDMAVLQPTLVSDNTHVLELVVKSGFAASRTEARNLINNRGISINDEVVASPTIIVSKSQFGKDLLLKKGKKNYFRFLIEEVEQHAQT